MKQKLIVITILISMLLNIFFVTAFAAGSNDDVDSLLNSILGDSPTKTETKNNVEKKETEKNIVIKRVIEDNYSTVIKKWEKEGKNDYKGKEIVVDFNNLVNSDKVTILDKENCFGYIDKAILFDEKAKEVEFQVYIDEDALYTIAVDYYPLEQSIIPIERSIQINNQYQYYESRRIVLDKTWKDKDSKFAKDSLGNEIQPEQNMIKKWQTKTIYEASLLYDSPLKFHLNKGKNTIKFIYIRNDMLLGRIYLKPVEEASDYKEYLKTINQNKKDNNKVQIKIEAEHPTYRSVPSIQPYPDNNPKVTPYRYGVLTLNTIGGQSWKNGGDAVIYTFNVEDEGLYNIAIKYVQQQKINLPSYRMILIDNKVPFSELKRYPFFYTTNWKMETLSENNEPYLIYLSKGIHTITLIANPSPYQEVIETIRKIMNDINNLSLEIKMATGNTQDFNRDWDLSSQIPDLIPRLKNIVKELKDKYSILKKLSNNKEGDARNLIICANQLEDILKNPDDIAYKIDSITTDQGSLMSILGDMLIKLPDQPLQIDKIYIYKNVKLQNENANVLEKLKASFVNFFLTFIRDYNQIGKNEKNSIQIWVNRPRQYVTLMQQMADQYFTTKTGIKVTMSLMPDEGKLVLANAAKKNPDIAMSISNWLPFNLALRNALYNLSEFSDFNQVTKDLTKGALLPFYYDGNCYAVPETQNFWVLFYRKDILDALKIDVPQTWEDVIKILPTLQRYGMNFYVPLSGTGGFKPFYATLPFIYQAGGRLYSDNGVTTEIDSEQSLNGFKLMTKLFTVYNLPLQVPNFYNHFRQGMLPIGVADFNTYIQLSAAAPELSGWWKIAPMPGIRNENGEIIRYAPGTGQAVVIFKNSQKKKEAWEFIKWWLSTDIQKRFGNLVETIYGSEYKWNTSNVEAFKELQWPKEDLDVILEQWKWLKDVIHFPGDYMLEREISNAWNKIVFDGANYRDAVESAVIETNREFAKKLEEFGFMSNGKLIKKYKFIDR